MTDNDFMELVSNEFKTCITPELYKRNGAVFIPAGITLEEVEELKKENTELKTRWQCRNKYMCVNNGKAVPCYILYGCLNCSFKSGDAE